MSDPKPTVEVSISYTNGEGDFYVCESCIATRSDDLVVLDITIDPKTRIGLHIERDKLNFIRRKEIQPEAQQVIA